jgi:hypothetical protein
MKHVTSWNLPPGETTPPSLGQATPEGVCEGRLPRAPSAPPVLSGTYVAE